MSTCRECGNPLWPRDHANRDGLCESCRTAAEHERQRHEQRREKQKDRGLK